MFENMVCGVANVGERKYRILAVFIIAVMVSMSAFLMPVQVYAAGEAISVLVGTLAGLITESVAGSALAAAGCAALIPEFAGALIAIAVGFGVTLTVYQLYQCFESWWGTSGNVSDFKMVAGSYDNTLHKVVATPFVFSLIVNLIKGKILGLQTSEVAEDNSVPTFTGMECLGSSVWSKDSHENKYEKEFEYKGLKITDIHHMMWNNGNRITHKVRLTSGNLTLNFQAPQVLDTKLRAESSYDYPTYDISINHYSPVFTSTQAKIGTSFKQVGYQNEINQYHKVQELKVVSCSYINKNNQEKLIKLTNYDPSTKKFYIPYSLKADCAGLILKDGTIVTTFDSDLDFAFKFFYKAAYYGEFTIKTGKFSSKVPLTTTAFPIPSLSESYSKSRDVISTTADDINKKIKTGDVTKDTAGSISIGMAPTAVGKLTNTSTAQDVKKVKITDVALPTQVEADKTAKEEAKIDPPGNIGAAFRQGGDMIIDGAMTISDKFPFDVIKCAYEWLQCLIQDGKPIVTEFTISIPKIGSVPVKIDFSERQDVVTVINWICIVGCGLGLILTSREWLKAI